MFILSRFYVGAGEFRRGRKKVGTGNGGSLGVGRGMKGSGQQPLIDHWLKKINKLICCADEVGSQGNSPACFLASL